MQIRWVVLAVVLSACSTTVSAQPPIMGEAASRRVSVLDLFLVTVENSIQRQLASEDARINMDLALASVAMANSLRLGPDIGVGDDRLRYVHLHNDMEKGVLTFSFYHYIDGWGSRLDSHPVYSSPLTERGKAVRLKYYEGLTEKTWSLVTKAIKEVSMRRGFVLEDWTEDEEKLLRAWLAENANVQIRSGIQPADSRMSQTPLAKEIVNRGEKGLAIICKRDCLTGEISVEESYFK